MNGIDRINQRDQTDLMNMTDCASPERREQGQGNLMSDAWYGRLSRDGMRSYFDRNQNFSASLGIEFVPIKAEKDPFMQGLDGGVRILFQD